MKPKVAKSASPAAIAMLRQATALAPLRKKASDGLLPSIAHLKQSPNSDHNTGLAVDLTHDPDHGIDCHEIFQKLKEDNRVDYLSSMERFGHANMPSRVTENIRVVIRITNTCTVPSSQSLQTIQALGSGGKINQA